MHQKHGGYNNKKTCFKIWRRCSLSKQKYRKENNHNQWSNYFVTVSHTTGIMLYAITIVVRRGPDLAWRCCYSHIFPSPEHWFPLNVPLCLLIRYLRVCSLPSPIFPLPLSLALSLSLRTTYQESQSIIPTPQLKHTEVTHTVKHTQVGNGSVVWTANH